MRFPRPIRLPREQYENIEQRFHVTIHGHPEVGAFAEPVRERIWQAVMNERERGKVVLCAACLMPDHLHLLLGPGSVDVVRFVASFKSWTTRLAWDGGMRGAIWQPSFYDRAVRDEADFGATAEYIVRNPLTAGLVEDERDWPHTWVWWWDE